jgi:alanyl-tRNA synthetase
LRARGYNLYLPIPYSRRCKITYDRPNFQQSKNRDDLLYYQINYRTYEPGTRVESFSRAGFEAAKGKIASQAGSDLSAQAEEINGVHVLTANLDGADSKALRDTLDQLKNKLGSAAIVLTSEDNGKVRVVAGVTKDQTALIKAGELVNVAAAEVGGKGGGRPDMAQAGGNQPENIDKALAAAKAWLKQKLT